MACPTMSPMSRWSRNWTPLTTRPSRTSRQGMILAAGIDRLRQAEFLLPERLADDGAMSADRAECAEIGERGDAARSLHRQRRTAGDDLRDQRAIGAGHHAVASDIGDQDMPGPGVERERFPEAGA